MKVTITQAAPHPLGLRLGLVVQGDKASWIRFAATVLVVEDLTEEGKQALTFALDRATYRSREDLSDDDLPLF